MWEYISHYWGLIAGSVGLIFGFGKLYQKQLDSNKAQRGLQERIVALEENQVVTSECLEHRKESQKIHKETQLTNWRAIELLRTDLKELLKSNEAQHLAIMDKGEQRQQEIMSYLMSMKK